MTGDPWLPVAVGLVLGYCLGAIPFGLLVTRFAGLGDIRAIGSGNIGATNVLRTGRKGLAATTLLLDALKGTAAVLLATRLLGPDAGLAAALGAFLGHCFPVWLRFRGGKGVATLIGVLLALQPWAVAAFAIAWLAVAAASRFSSLAALVASLAALATLGTLDGPRAGTVLAFAVAILWIKHRPNIARLLTGRESRIGQKA